MKNTIYTALMNEAVADAYSRLIRPSIENEIRSDIYPAVFLHYRNELVALEAELRLVSHMGKAATSAFSVNGTFGRDSLRRRLGYFEKLSVSDVFLRVSNLDSDGFARYDVRHENRVSVGVSYSRGVCGQSLDFQRDYIVLFHFLIIVREFYRLSEIFNYREFPILVRKPII